jgi:hypothetical protein
MIKIIYRVLEDYWIPRREGSRGTEISVLPGGQAMSQIEDVRVLPKEVVLGAKCTDQQTRFK